MTARASTAEHACSNCRGLVLRGEFAGAPICVECARVVCDACQLGGLCAACFHRHYSAPLEALDDERVVRLVTDECGHALARAAAYQDSREEADAAPR